MDDIYCGYLNSGGHPQRGGGGGGRQEGQQDPEGGRAAAEGHEEEVEKGNIKKHSQYLDCVWLVQVSRQGDWLVFTEKVGVLTTQAGTQQVQEKRVRVGSDDLEKLVELGY